MERRGTVRGEGPAEHVQLDREVAVGVGDHAERTQRGRPHARFLPELPDGGLHRGLAGLELPAGELPESPEQSGVGAPLHEPPPVPFEDHDRTADMRLRPALPPDGEGRGVGELLGGAASEPDRAVRAGGRDRTADRLAELHQRLVELPRRVARQHLLQSGREASADPGGGDVARVACPPRGDPEAVRLEGDHGGSVEEARQSARHIRAHARKLLPLGDGRWEAPGALPDDPLGRLVEVARAGVVAGSLPGLQDLLPPGPGQRLDGGEATREPLEVGDRLLDAGLLKEHLGDPDLVRVAVGPPGERASVGAEPVEECSGERPGDRSRRSGGARGPHRASREEPRG